MRKADISRYIKIISIALCVCFIALFAFSLLHIMWHGHRDCSERQCPVCAVIQAILDTVKTLSALAILSVIIGMLALRRIERLDYERLFSISHPTLQTLKVQFNN